MTRNDKLTTAVLAAAAALAGFCEGSMCAVVFYILTVCAAFDLKERIIPDRFPASGVFVWMLYAIGGAHNGELSCIHLLQTVTGVLLNVLGAFVIAAAILLLTLIYEKLRHRKAIGGGDIKLLFMISLFMGPDKTLYVMLLTCVIAVFFSIGWKNYGVFPLAPAIALAVVIVTVVC